MISMESIMKKSLFVLLILAVLVGLAVSCASSASAAGSGYADGVYEGEGQGFGGKVPVTVTVQGGKIVSVEVGQNGETAGIGSRAIDILPAQIVEKQGVAGVDAVAGASFSSKAILDAVKAALGIQ
jgi:uncharacterized protein with FMN-binding domain